MDEPFGAIDPVTRVRLQDEFLRLQDEVRKTIVFVTHDIEEAVKMGDRIAILDVGGILAQYDTPAEVLGNPASAMVADFVGADRGLKRLKVTPIDPGVPRAPADRAARRLARRRPVGSWASGARPGSRSSTSGAMLRGHVRLRPTRRATADVAGRTERVEAWVSVDDYLENALAAMLLTDYGWVAVVDGDRFVGVLTPDAIYRALRSSLDDAAAVTSDGEVDTAPDSCFVRHHRRSPMNSWYLWTAPVRNLTWVAAHYGYR